MQTRFSYRRVLTASALSAILLAAPAIAMPTVGAQTAESSQVSHPITAPSDTDDDKLLEAPDTVSALAGAHEMGEQVEDLSQRTESVMVVANPDGSFTSTTDIEPVRVKQAGEWADVDFNLEQQDDGIFAPTMENPPRTPWPRGQHDYCSGWKKWLGTPDSFKSILEQGSAATKVSFKGPCARHDLCIDFKQATDRSFCDTQFRKDLRQNCQYYLRKYTGGDYKRRTNYCYDRAQFYYNRVKGATNGKTDPGHWGWDEVVPMPYTWPSMRYDTWQ